MPKGAVDEKKNERNPEPRDDFALNFCADRNVGFLLLLLFFRFHFAPLLQRLREWPEASDGLLRNAIVGVSKRFKQPAPAYRAGMQKSVGISREARAYSAGFPGVAGGVDGRVDHYRCADDIFARNAADEAAVVGVAAVVAHNEK